MSDEALDVLTGQIFRTVAIDGAEITVRPLQVRQLSPVARAIQFTWPEIAGYLRDPGTLDAAAWLGLLANHTVAIVSALTAAIDHPNLRLSERHPDDLLRLALAVVEVNLDFFSQRIAPALVEIAQVRAAITAGLTPSPD